MFHRVTWSVVVCSMLVAGHGAEAQFGQKDPVRQSDPRPWMDPKVAPEKRADIVLKEMTLDEKITLLHGEGSRPRTDKTIEGLTVRALNNGDVGFTMGIERLGIPPIQMQDAAYGVRMSARNGRYSTALPSNLGAAASWDLAASCAYGTLIGSELRAQGYNMTLGGGTNITREPRNGRTFEYMGEDPVLAGTMVGARIRCEGEQHVISDIKHYALNDQESGRTSVDVYLGERAMRETDLMAFEIGLRAGHPNAVMCSYNGINGNYGCENKYLLTDVLKNEWKFPGYVISDWGATHSVEKASAAGLDQEQPEAKYFGEPLKLAVQAGRVPMAELDEHVRRILYAEFASGIVDNPQKRSVVDVFGGMATARRIEEGSAVLLRNQNSLLPLDRNIRKLAVIGPHADMGMISGGGSAQVDPPGETAGERWRAKVWFPTSPLKALQAKIPGAEVSFSSGEKIADAVKAAKAADVAVVFVYQWESEDFDLPTLALEEGQAELIAEVAKANPRTVVVVESGSAVTMPWLDQTGAVLEAWFAGSDGANAVANLLFGDVNPSGKLPMTFPLSNADLPHPTLLKPPAGSKNGDLTFKVTYDEGLKVGYKWYESEHKKVLFPFGFGLSYTSFNYSGLKVSKDGSEVTLTVTNSGKMKGAEIAEVYAALPDSTGEPPKRLIGYQKIELAPGESNTLHIAVDPMYLSVWDEGTHKWTRPAGQYKIMAGGSSVDLPLTETISLK